MDSTIPKLTQYQTVALGPCAHDIARGLALVHCPTQRLAIQRDDLLGDRFAQTLRPAEKALQKLLGIQGLKYPIECVVRRNAMAQFQKSFEPLFLGFAEILHVIETFSRAEQTTYRNDQHVDQIVFFGSINPRV